MSNYLVRVVLFSLLAWSATIAPATAAERAAVKYRFKLPPSADLVYSIKARQSGLAINGDALIQWNAANNKFSVTTETRAMLVGKILDAKNDQFYPICANVSDQGRRAGSQQRDMAADRGGARQPGKIQTGIGMGVFRGWTA
jgi:hypothetical protein